MILVVLPVFHTIGTNLVLFTLIQGAAVHLMREFEPGAVRDALAGGGVHSVTLVPTVLAMLSEPGVFAAGAPPRIAAPVLERVLRLFDARIHQVYASTETTGAATILSDADHRLGPGRLASAGRAMRGFTVTVVGEDGVALPAGKTGEIVIRGPSVFTGYWRNPEASAEVLRPDGYHSGDAGFLDADGYLTVVDRTRDMMISGGENIYLRRSKVRLHGIPASPTLRLLACRTGFGGKP